MVAGRRKDKLVAELVAGTHSFLADVNAKLGGTDQGPNPHELAESALAACTIITLQMYANRQAWKLDSSNINVTIDKEGPESHITREIQLVGDLTLEQKAKLFEIANKCPIHKLLSSHITISTTEASS